MDATTQKRRANAVKSMLGTDGWQIIEEDFTHEMQTLTADLLEADSIEDVQRLKYEVKAIKRLFDKIKSYAEIR